MGSNGNIKLKGMKAAFKKVDDDGKKHSFKGEPWVANMVESHVQGVARYKNYDLLTHNNKGYSKGFIVVINRDDEKMVYKFDTPKEHFNHPGGLQVVGDYAAVAVENSSYDESYIYFYHLDKMNDKDEPDRLDYKIHRNSGAGAVGITDFDNDGVRYYWLAVLSGKKVTFYLSNGLLLSDPDISFSKKFDDNLNKDDYQGIALVTDQDNKIYLIGFRSESEFTSYKDKVVLYSIDTDEEIIDKGKDRQMTTHHGDIKGQAGVHFRWGAGLQVTDDTKLKFFATQRNFTGGKVFTNTFK